MAKPDNIVITNAQVFHNGITKAFKNLKADDENLHYDTGDGSKLPLREGKLLVVRDYSRGETAFYVDIPIHDCEEQSR